MNPAHLHLLVNHIPIFLCLIGLALLVYSLGIKSYEVQKVSLGLLVLAGLSAFAGYFSGESAEVVIKNYPNISFSIMEKHENLALYALIGIIFLSLISLASLLFAKYLQSKNKAKLLMSLILLVGLAEAILLAQVAQLGGKIRHEEIRSPAEE